MANPNELLFGKANKHRVVAVEIKDDQAELWIQNPDHSISSETVPNKFWILRRDYSPGWHKLKGNLYYNYGKQFLKRREFEAARKKLKDDDIYSIWEPREAFQVKDGYTLFQGLEPQDVSILGFDLETTTKDPNDPNAKILLISGTFRKNGTYERKLFAYDEFSSQGSMLTAFCDWVREKDPSIITGYWIVGFDIPYMASIASQEGVELILGRDGSPIRIESRESYYRVDQTRSLTYYKSHIYGRNICDGLFLSYKYDVATKKYESYSLKHIIKVEGLEKQGRTHYDASQIRFKYQDPKEWAKIKEYCKDDSDDAIKIYDLMAPSLFYWTQMVPKPFETIVSGATGSQINALMLRAYLQEGHSIPKADNIKESFEGAISAGSPGIYNNCLKWDVASLYPSIILQYQIYPKKKDPNRYFLQILQYLTDERLKNKRLAKETGKKYYKDLEQSQKIGINSAYGFMGAAGLNFNDLFEAAEVTRRGREVLTRAIEWATGEKYE